MSAVVKHPRKGEEEDSSSTSIPSELSAGWKLETAAVAEEASADPDAARLRLWCTFERWEQPRCVVLSRLLLGLLYVPTTLVAIGVTPWAGQTYDWRAHKEARQLKNLHRVFRDWLDKSSDVPSVYLATHTGASLSTSRVEDDATLEAAVLKKAAMIASSRSKTSKSSIALDVDNFCWRLAASREARSG